MPRLQYGQTTIEWRFKADATLKRHYLTVERGRPVLLRGPAVGLEEQEALVRQRAGWIREKRALVEAPAADEQIVTGSRLRYCGRSYFTELRHAPELALDRRSAPEGTVVNAHVSTDRPERFGLGICRDFRLGRLPSNDIVIQAAAFEHVEWWLHGQQEVPA